MNLGGNELISASVMNDVRIICTSGSMKISASGSSRMCHGEKGAGRPNDVLVGGFDTIAAPDKPAVKTVGSYWPYATTLFDYVRRAKGGLRAEATLALPQRKALAAKERGELVVPD